MEGPWRCDVWRYFLILGLVSCDVQAPIPPEGVSIALVCSYKGFTVMKGYLVVAPETLELAERQEIDFDDYTLECDSKYVSDMTCWTIPGGDHG